MARHQFWTRAKHRVGLERPHFWLPSAGQHFVGSLQPRKRKRSVCQVFCPRPVKQEKEEKRRKHMSIINKPPQHVKREYELEEPVALVRREVRHVHRKHPGSCRQFRPEDPAVEGQALHELEKAAATGRQDGATAVTQKTPAKA